MDIKKDEKCEEIMTELSIAIHDTYRAFYPEGNFLEVKVWNDCVHIINNFWCDDVEFPIQINKKIGGKHSGK